MAYRIWSSERFSAKYRLGNRSLLPYLRILIESAALQLIAELIVLALYASGLNAQYILLEALTPVVVCGTRSNRVLLLRLIYYRELPSMQSPSASRFARLKHS